MTVIIEHIKAGTGRGKQNRITRFCRFARQFHRLLHGRCMNNLHHAPQPGLDLACRLTDQHQPFHLFAHGRSQQSVIIALVPAPGDQDHVSGKLQQRAEDRPGIGGLRVVIEGHPVDFTDLRQPVRTGNKLPESPLNSIV